MGSSQYLHLPRNYSFISRLPQTFEVEVIRKANETKQGIWYSCKIGNHDLNLLSVVSLQEGKKYRIRKKDHVTLELDNQSVHSRQGGHEVDFLG